MLVLSRKPGERIHIGEKITVEIRRIAGNRVTLALRAPREVRILRGELQQAAKEFRDPAAETPSSPDPARKPCSSPRQHVHVVEHLPVQDTPRDYVI